MCFILHPAFSSPHKTLLFFLYSLLFVVLVHFCVPIYSLLLSWRPIIFLSSLFLSLTFIAFNFFIYCFFSLYIIYLVTSLLSLPICQITRIPSFPLSLCLIQTTTRVPFAYSPLSLPPCLPLSHDPSLLRIIPALAKYDPGTRREAFINTPLRPVPRPGFSVASHATLCWSTAASRLPPHWPA